MKKYFLLLLLVFLFNDVFAKYSIYTHKIIDNTTQVSNYNPIFDSVDFDSNDTKSSVEKIHQITLRANLLYWASGLMNVGLEYKNVDSRFGFLVNGGYSFLGNTNWNKNLGGWFVSPEVRYYLGSSEKLFVGAQFLMGGYNFKQSETGYQGSVISGGIMCGYKLTLSKTFDMDFTLGAGYGTLNYDTYYHTDDNVNVYIDKAVKNSSIMPIQLGVTLIWKI